MGTFTRATNHAGDHYTGCNWQSVDLIPFSQSGPLVIGIDALDAGGTGGLIATVRVDGMQDYPSNAGESGHTPFFFQPACVLMFLLLNHVYFAVSL